MGSVLGNSKVHRACVRAATAPAISYRNDYRLPLKEPLRKESQIIGGKVHQGKSNFFKDS